MREEEIIVSVDAMGGDNAPFSAIKACGLVSPEEKLRLILVGNRDAIGNHENFDNHPYVEILNTEKYIGMEDKVNLQMIKSKDNSMCRTVLLHKEGRAHYALSAGNTAAFVSYAISELGLIENIERPAISILLPNMKGTFTVFADAGANANAKPFHILQAAQMNSIFASTVFGVKDPSVSLLNIGSEATKGDELRKAAFPLLEKGGINFKGNIEGQELFSGKTDVVIADGFTGNVVLKVTEGMTRSFKTMLFREIRRSLLGKACGFLLRGSFRNFAKKVDYAEYGGGILLGVNGIVVISHGRSSPRALYSAIKFGKKVVMSDLLGNLKKFAEKK